MDPSYPSQLEDIRSTDKQLQNRAYTELLAATEQPVDWAYQAWDQLVADLRSTDNHVRAIAAQLLANLAKSDPEQRMLKDFEALLAVIKDERFVTARHALQSLWKVGAAGKALQQVVVDGLARRYAECAPEKNATLIRYDIIQALRTLYDAVGDESVRAKALELIETEPDLKYRKKYETVWRGV